MVFSYLKKTCSYWVQLLDSIRKIKNGNIVTFASSYYLNYTNVCIASGSLCAFYRKGSENDAYTLTSEQIVERARLVIKQMGVTELHIVGGLSKTWT